MEVVAGVSSVVAIVGLVERSISGIAKIQRLVRGMSSNPRTLADFLEELQSLEHDLIAIHGVLGKAPEDLSVDTIVHVDALKSLAGKCLGDINRWAKEAAKMSPTSSGSVNAFFKKIRIASDPGAISDFHRKVESYRQRLQLSLDLFGRCFDLNSYQRVKDLTGKLGDLSMAQESFNSRLIQALDRVPPRGNVPEPVSSQQSTESSQLDRLEQSTQRSSASISSIASDVSRILEFVSAGSGAMAKLSPDISKESSLHYQTGAETLAQASNGDHYDRTDADFEWCCDAILGIEEAFGDYGNTIICRYCRKQIDYCNDGWYGAGKHLVERHNFGGCNLFLPYYSEPQFRKHLVEYHKMSVSDDIFVFNHQLPRRTTRFNRGIESDIQILTDADEAAESQLIYKASLDALISNLTRADATLSFADSLKEDKQAMQNAWQLEWEVACLEENSIVHGHDFDCFGYFWQYLTRSSGEQALDSEQLRTSKDPLSINFQPEQTVITRSPRPLLEYISSVQRYNSPFLLNRDPESQRKLLSLMRDSINDWLWDILKCSCTTRIFMRYAMHADSLQVPDMREWLEKVLDYWDKDGTATGRDKPYETSDGALDSRDSLRTRPFP